MHASKTGAFFVDALGRRGTMATLILQSEEDADLAGRFIPKVLREYAAGPMITIGRLADNTIVIDNPAVSSHHACIFRDGDQFVVEDLQSTNGTFVNDQRVARHTLQHGDVVAVGKHKLRFDEQKTAKTPEAPVAAEPIIRNVNETMFLDSKQHRALLNRLMDAEAYAGKAKASDSADKVAVLRVLAGSRDQSEYTLNRHTSLIGSGSGCLVRLRGWFQPAVAVAITRNRFGYVATRLGRTALINGQKLGERCELKDGDLLQVRDLTLEFRWKASEDKSPVPPTEPARSDVQTA
jgi:pSer/pThr/pTyr-binding forkhead associated (FHA) protein